MIHKTIKPLHYLSILFLIFLFSTNFVQAQEDNLTSSFNKNRYLKIEFSCLGGNIDLSGSGSDLLGQRSVLGFAGSFLRVTHLFSNKWGWYAGTEMNLVKEKNSPYYNASFGDAVGEVMRRVLFGGFTPTVGADAGMVYRVEKKTGISILDWGWVWVLCFCLIWNRTKIKYKKTALRRELCINKEQGQICLSKPVCRPITFMERGVLFH